MSASVKRIRRDGLPAKPAGRPAGVPNKINRDIKEMMFKALHMVGGERYLAKRAVDTPGPFLTLLGKILPTQVVGGDGTNVSLHLIAATLVSQQLVDTRTDPPRQQLEATALDLSKQPTE